VKIILIHPPHPDSMDDRLDPPLGLLYIAASLNKSNFDVEILDLSGVLTYEIPYADVYGITAYISTLKIVEDISEKCRKINPYCKIIIGGAHATSRPNDFPYADHIVIGPGENAIISILTKYNVPRIVSEEVLNPLINLPAYHLIDINSYTRKIDGQKSIPYLTTRGCPFYCSFCGLSKMHKLAKLSMSSPETVYKHLSIIKNNYGISSINFQDDIFTLNKKRLFKILELIKPLNLKFRCMGRAGYDNEKVYEKLAEAGCIQISFGAESGSQYILDRMNKQAKVKDNYNVIQWAKKYGITSRAFFIIGFPGETKDTLDETKKFIEEADPDQIFASNFVPYPGTDVGENPDKYGITNMSNNYDDYYQVSEDGTGGITIDTKWLSKNEFRELEIKFRNWLKKRPMRGYMQDYEEKIRSNGISKLIAEKKIVSCNNEISGSSGTSGQNQFIHSLEKKNWKETRRRHSLRKGYV